MKQKLLSFLLALLPIVASADAVEIDGIYYNLINKGRIAEVTGGKNDEIVLIPETVIYNEIPYQVTKIGAFAGKEKLKSINIPKSIVTISEGAFYYCDNLNAIYINDLEAWCKISYEGEEYVINPLDYAKHLYLNGDEIIDLVIPSTVEEISDIAFRNGEFFKTITIPNNVKKIGMSAFAGCSGVTSVTIGDGVTSISDGSFAFCNRLTSITIGSSVASIGAGAFAECSSLINVNIPNNVTSIGNSAFQFCI